ncbi:MAG: class I tRNA ligase family protein, partial [Alphaproteobacteria bacterium]
WYLELIKPLLLGDDDAIKAETRATAAWVMQGMLKLLHPFMPFVTEELWEHFGGPENRLLITANWPQLDAALADATAGEEMDWVIRLVSAIRTARAEVNVPAAAKIPAVLRDAGPKTRARLANHRDQIQRLARISDVQFSQELPTGAIQIVLDEATIALPLSDVMDLGAEKARLAKEINRLEGDITKIDKKLANAGFLAKAPAEVIEIQRERRIAAQAAGDKLRAALQRLDAT